MKYMRNSKVVEKLLSLSREDAEFILGILEFEVLAESTAELIFYLAEMVKDFCGRTEVPTFMSRYANPDMNRYLLAELALDVIDEIRVVQTGEEA